ncbi:MAG: DUF488 domain-containing protein, partial [Actinobacteria bacterium]|nr:DUF488 domain-containing protein [Actinomycetota bacterium]
MGGSTGSSRCPSAADPVPGRLTTIGYEGLIVDELVDQLRADGVEVVVDVRLNPISRKPGLSKTRLAAALDAVGIGYVHERALGNPPDNRAALRAGDADAWERLRAQLASAAAVAA